MPRAIDKAETILTSEWAKLRCFDMGAFRHTSMLFVFAVVISTTAAVCLGVSVDDVMRSVVEDRDGADPNESEQDELASCAAPAPPHALTAMALHIDARQDHARRDVPNRLHLRGPPTRSL